MWQLTFLQQDNPTATSLSLSFSLRTAIIITLIKTRASNSPISRIETFILPIKEKKDQISIVKDPSGWWKTSSTSMMSSGTRKTGQLTRLGVLFLVGFFILFFIYSSVLSILSFWWHWADTTGTVELTGQVPFAVVQPEKKLVFSMFFRFIEQ